MDAPTDEVISHVLDAASAGDWEQLKLLLHPYVLWNRGDGDGVSARGRTKVLRWLASRPAQLARPARVELRDGQIYRWWSS